ncbi:hypothetical protein BJ165DRAFT_1490373 [Panaeolus papilionaceus]|nr:hypothetical protein BJ165DRAFT_1490373 [Panaeolus papilionaceus]
MLVYSRFLLLLVHRSLCPGNRQPIYFQFLTINKALGAAINRFGPCSKRRGVGAVCLNPIPMPNPRLNVLVKALIIVATSTIYGDVLGRIHEFMST